MLKKYLRALVTRSREKKAIKNFQQGEQGSSEWLISTEIKFGGKVQGVRRKKVSPHDTRSKEDLKSGGMVGGDRMFHHGYAEKYSEYLLPIARKKDPITLVEVGILKGNGLAIWCELFQNSRIIGFDIDLNHFMENKANLERKGAFKHVFPELYEFDQFLDNAEMVESILKGNKLDVCIDDGFHSEETVLMTLKSLYPHLSSDFVYFIEDNDKVHTKIREAYQDLNVDSSGELTILSRKK